MRQDAVSRYMRERKKKLEAWQNLVTRAQSALDVYEASRGDVEDLLWLAGELIIVSTTLHRSVIGSHVTQPATARRAIGNRGRAKAKGGPRKKRKAAR